MPVSRVAAALCFSVLVVCSQASDNFLDKETTKRQRVDGLLDDLEATVGHDKIRGPFMRLNLQTNPMLLSLPKNSKKLLNPATARYALHRINMDRHGWSINGIQPGKDTFNTLNLTISDILGGMLPQHVLEIFGKHIMLNDGISLDDVTMMASTIEYFAHEDQKRVLRSIGEAFDLPTTGPMRDDEMRNIIKTYLVVLLDYVNIPELVQVNNFEQVFSYAESMYPAWQGAAMLVDDETDTVAYMQKDILNPFRVQESSMHLASQIVQQVVDHFSTKSLNLDCKEIGNDLLEHEIADTGRVRLADFYRASLTSRFFFVEAKEYLRATGALDETDAFRGPKVIVPNYVYAEANCLASSNSYSVCCKDECEDLYGSLEKTIAASETSAEQIISHVSAMSSPSVQAPRILSQVLVERLREIASAHGGSVILHSRLFAQWMHQAFPRECRYPHLAGTITEMPPDEWTLKTGLQWRIDHAGKDSQEPQLLEHIAELDRIVLANNESNATAVDLMWSPEDEHLVEPQLSLFRSILLWLPYCALLLLVIAMLSKASEKELIHTEKKQQASSDLRCFNV